MAGESDRDNFVDRLLADAMRTSLAPASASCLDAERLAAWSDGALADADARAIDVHLAGCARCQAMLAVFARTMPATPAPAPFWSRRLVQWLVPLVTAAAAIVAWSVWPRTQPPAPAVPTMARAQPFATPSVPEAAPVVTSPASTGTAASVAKSGPDRGAAAQRAAAAPSSAPTRSAKAEPLAGDLRPASLRPAPVMAPPPPAAVTTPTLTTSLPRSDRNALTFVPLPATLPPPAGPPATQPPTPPTPPPAAGAGAAAAQGVVGGIAPPAGGAIPPNPRSSTIAGLPQNTINISIDGVNTTPPVIEFWSPDPARGGLVGGAVAGAAGAGGGRGGGGGRGAGGGGGASGAGAARVSLTTPVRWRILTSRTVERSLDGGASWDPIAIDPPVTLTGGAAASSVVCWLFGPQGVVLRATDGMHFARVLFPETVNLISIRAIDALQATVQTSDGRLFTTTDGGQTWTRVG